MVCLAFSRYSAPTEPLPFRSLLMNNETDSQKPRGVDHCALQNQACLMRQEIQMVIEIVVGKMAKVDDLAWH